MKTSLKNLLILLGPSPSRLCLPAFPDGPFAFMFLSFQVTGDFSNFFFSLSYLENFAHLLSSYQMKRTAQMATVLPVTIPSAPSGTSHPEGETVSPPLQESEA